AMSFAELAGTLPAIIMGNGTFPGMILGHGGFSVSTSDDGTTLDDGSIISLVGGTDGNAGIHISAKNGSDGVHGGDITIFAGEATDDGSGSGTGGSINISAGWSDSNDGGDVLISGGGTEGGDA